MFPILPAAPSLIMRTADGESRLVGFTSGPAFQFISQNTTMVKMKLLLQGGEQEETDACALQDGEQVLLSLEKGEGNENVPSQSSAAQKRHRHQSPKLSYAAACLGQKCVPAIALPLDAGTTAHSSSHFEPPLPPRPRLANLPQDLKPGGPLPPRRKIPLLYMSEFNTQFTWSPEAACFVRRETKGKAQE